MNLFSDTDSPCTAILRQHVTLSIIGSTLDL